MFFQGRLVRPWPCREWRRGSLQRFEQPHDALELEMVEAAACMAGILQAAIVVVPEEQRTERPPGGSRVGPSADHEFLFLNDLELSPIARPLSVWYSERASWRCGPSPRDQRMEKAHAHARQKFARRSMAALSRKMLSRRARICVNGSGGAPVPWRRREAMNATRRGRLLLDSVVDRCGQLKNGGSPF